LKGSGRMVGLTDLGEIAWEIEQLMNRWLEQERPASPALLDVISTSSTAFAGWVAVLQAGNWPTLDAERIVDYARKLKAGEDPGAPLAGPAVQQRAPAEAAPQPAPTPEPEELLIGGVSLTRPLFDIYLGEAVQHVGALEAECSGWRSTPGAP